MRSSNKIIYFIVINAATLLLCRWVMSDGLASEWYKNTQRAPWTPPAWAFGVAWSTIMLCYAVYMHKLSSITKLSSIQFISYCWVLALCIAWNALFFAWQYLTLGALALAVLTLSVSIITAMNYRTMKYWSLLMLPFIIWTSIATSLNIYSIS